MENTHLIIPFSVKIGQAPTAPEIGLPKDSPYTCTGTEWLHSQTDKKLEEGEAAQQGVPYKLKVVLEIRGEAAEDYVFTPFCNVAM